MKNFLVVICFLFIVSGFSQNLENNIYNATELFNSKKNNEALKNLNDAISIFEAKLSTEDEYMAFIFLLVNKAYYLKSKSQNTNAISTYEKAWKLYKNKNIASFFEYDIIENCLKPLGVLYNKVGDYTSCENITKNYIALAKKTNNTTQQIAGTINLSRLYQTTNRHQQAIDIATYGLNINGTSKQQKSNLKRLISRSQIRLNKKVTIIDRIIFSSDFLGKLEDKELAYELAMQNQDYKAALKAFKSIKHLKTSNLSSASELAKLYLEEAQIHYKLNNFNAAEKNLNHALKTLLKNYNRHSIPTETELYPENAFIGVFDLLATIESNPKKALDYYKLSFYVSDLLAKNTTTQDGKLILLNEKRSRSEKCLNLLYTLQNKSEDTYFTTEALKISERYKASVLNDILDKKDLLKKHPKDSLLLKQQSLLQKQEQLTNRLIKSPYNSNPNQKNKIREQLSFINIDLKKVNQDIENKFTTQNKPLNISKLITKLEQDKASLVNFFYGKKAIYQIIISNKVTVFNKIELSKNNTNLIKEFISYFDNSSVINNNIQAYTKKAHELYTLLNLNSVSHLNNILIIPDGLLNFIPFDALITNKTESKSFNQIPFFVKTHTTVYNANCALYLNNNPNIIKPKVLGVFPVYKSTKFELPNSITEAEKIENTIKTKILINEEATKNAFISNANAFSILHLSTHGTSGDFYTPAQISFIDTAFSTNELYKLNLTANLVVLSACETGVGMLHRGEGAMSIARGFQYAGVENTVYSLWQISDLSTSQIMASFYKNLSKTNAINYANRQSKIDYLNNNKITNIKKSPFFWSAFNYYGSFNSVKKDYTYIWSIVVISIVIIVLLLFLFKKKNGKRTLGILTRKRI